MRRTWTLPELRRCVAEYEGGDTWVTVGARRGLTGDAMRDTVTKRGIPYRSRLNRRNRAVPHEAELLEAIRIRNTEDLSWSLIAERVGWPLTVDALRLGCTRYVARKGGGVAQGRAGTVRSRWD